LVFGVNDPLFDDVKLQPPAMVNQEMNCLIFTGIFTHLKNEEAALLGRLLQN